MDRLACVDIVALPLQLLLRTEPDWARAPVAVVEDDRPQALVLYANARARRLGVRPGQRFATALAFAKDLRAGTVSRSQIARHITQLADSLRLYSPHVEPSTDTEGVFWLDAQGLERLHPSLQTWAEGIREGLQRLGLRASIAVGFTRFGTYALARYHRGVTCYADEADEAAAVARVPLTQIDLAPDATARLHALGITTVGDFLRLPGDGIRQRFGDAAHARYVLASGRRWAPLVPVPAEARYEQEIHFDAPESHTERLVFIVKRLLDMLLSAIARQARAVVAPVMWMKLDDRSTRTEQLRPAASTLDAAQLLTLVRLRLDTLRLSSGIVTLRMTAETCPAASHQRLLFDRHARRDLDAAQQAFARLRAEFHEEVVVRARMQQAHLPAARFVWELLDRMPAAAAPRIVPSRPLVRRIYARSASLQGRPDRRLFGPYVVSGGWWAGGVQRDYYFTLTDRGTLRWVYYDHRTRRLFLQGLVE